MLTHERKAYLLKRLQTDGRLVAKDLSRELRVSEDTVRRDLRELAADGRLKRVHGGALPHSPATVPFAAREQIATDGKVAIGRRAAAMIGTGQTVFLDGGTTAVQLARHLPPSLAATVVTASPSVAVELVQRPALVVELIGGRLFPHSVVTTGTTALANLDRFRPDLCFIGVTGVHAEIGLTTGDGEDAAMKRAAMERSGETIILASAEKIGAASAAVIAPCAAAQVILVDAAAEPAKLAPLQALADLAVVVAD